MYYDSILTDFPIGTRLKIAMVDDHSLLRDALINTINGFNNCEVILRASNGVELMQQMQASSMPDIIILDLNMPLMDGHETARWLKLNYPKINILILSMFDSEVTLVRLLQLGVKAFLRKDTHPNELKYAIQCVMEEGYYYPQTISGKLANVFHNPDKGFYTQPVVLSESEVMFLKLASSELTYKQIAKEMYISPRTVDNYRDQLFTKLKVRSRVGLAIYAIRNGIVNF
jgi:DNA-binding NarL/FixJ family response regulator